MYSTMNSVAKSNILMAAVPQTRTTSGSALLGPAPGLTVVFDFKTTTVATLSVL